MQNYITAILVFLIVEQLMTWGFYNYQNIHGINVVAKVLMIIVAVLNAGRNAFSFFLLLIVCMGYGVVKPSLGRTMVYVRILAIAHFVFAVVYSITSLSITPDSAGPLVLLIVLPLAGTLTAFYVWTLNSLNATMKDLIDRRQKTKALMYKKLWWCILGSIIVIFGFFFLNSFAFAGRNDENFVPDHWKSRWFVLDGWLNIVYLFDITFVAYLWRPTANNRRFAMSEEVCPISPSVNPTILTKIRSSPKMTTGSRFARSAAAWMRKILLKVRRLRSIRVVRKLLAAGADYRPCPLSLSPRPRGRSMRKRSLPWVTKMQTDGPRTTNPLAALASENDSRARTRYNRLSQTALVFIPSIYQIRGLSACHGVCLFCFFFCSRVEWTLLFCVCSLLGQSSSANNHGFLARQWHVFRMTKSKSNFDIHPEEGTRTDRGWTLALSYSPSASPQSLHKTTYHHFFLFLPSDLLLLCPGLSHMNYIYALHQSSPDPRTFPLSFNPTPALPTQA